MKHFYLLLFVCLLAPVLAAQPVFNWTSQEIKAGNNLQKMTVFNDQAVIAGFGRTFVKSTDNGNSWHDTGILETEFDFVNMSFKGLRGYLVSSRSKLYEAFPDPYTNGVILTTADAGLTWTNVSLTGLGSGDDPALAPSAPKSYGLDFHMVGCVNDSTVYCALRWLEFKPDTTSGYKEHAGIFRSTNKGVSWKNISGDLKGAVINSFAFFDTICYIGGNKRLYKASTKSEVLTDIFSGLNTSNAFVNDIQAVSKDEIYVITSTTGAFKSTDGGENFTKYTISGVTGGNDLLKVNNNTLVMVGSSGKSRISNDGGNTWNDALLSVAIWEIGGIFNDSLVVLAKSDIYKIKLTDLNSGNYKWMKQTVSPDNNIHKMHVVDEYNALLIGLGATFKRTNDLGKTWTNIEMPVVPLYDDDLDFIGLRNVKDTAYACMNRFYLVDYPSSSPLHDIYWSGGVFKTTNNWATYSSLDAALIGKDEGNDASKNPQLGICNGLNTSVIEYVGNNVVLLWARWYDVSGATKVEHSRVFRSADAGKSWKVVSQDFGGSTYVQDIKFRDETGYVAGNKILQKSTNRGETFTDIYPALKSALGADLFINAITLGPGNALYVTGTTAVLSSSDGGTTFTKLTGTTGGNDFFRFDPDSWMVLGTTSKCQYTNDAGTNWVGSSPGATIYEIGGIWNGNFYALGQGKVYRTPVEGLNTNVREIPSGTGLVVLYKTSSVELVLQEKTIDRCTIWSVTGKMITDIRPGSNRCEFSFRSYTPGVYIARTMAGGKLYTNKILIP